MKGITNANNVANSEVNAKQPLLVSGENIKTVNGNSLLGAGNIAIDTYQPFPAGWRTSGTIDQLMADITADNSAVVGMAYLGEVTCSDLPFNGNAELIVNIMNGSGSSKVIWAELTSGDTSPYFWHYTYWNSHGSGWRGYIPSSVNVMTTDTDQTVTGTKTWSSEDNEPSAAHSWWKELPQNKRTHLYRKWIEHCCMP